MLTFKNRKRCPECRSLMDGFRRKVVRVRGASIPGDPEWYCEECEILWIDVPDMGLVTAEDADAIRKEDELADKKFPVDGWEDDDE